MNEPKKVSVIPPEEPAGPAAAAHGEAERSGVSPLEMLNRAVLAGADIALIEKLMALHERWDANQSRKAYDRAVAAAKRDIPPITRNTVGHNAKKYADIAAIAKAIDPIIGKHGLSYRYRTTQTDRIYVTCILSHELGHSEETTLSGPADTSGSKNAIQAIGSTLTYLQRYSLVQMLGLAAGSDDDGKAAGDGEVISDEQLKDLIGLADEVGADKIAFCRYFFADRIKRDPEFLPSLADIQAKDLPRAIAALNKKRAK